VRGAFFLSGAAALLFQVVWLYRCGLVFGSSVTALSLVVSAFMAGLAAGNGIAAWAGDRLTRPLVFYAALEICAGVTGLGATALLPHLTSTVVAAVHASGGSSVLLNVLRGLLAFTLLALPTTAMGITLPLVVRAMCRPGDRLGAALGTLYGWNTAGGVAGVLAGEVVLIARVGVGGTAWIAALTNGVAGLLGWMVTGQAFDLPDEEAGVPPSRRASRTSAAPVSAYRLLACTAICGALLLGLEVIWFRFLSMYVLITTLATSTMLAVVLAAIAVGGFVAGQLLRRRPAPAGAITAACGVAGCWLILSYVLFQVATSGTQVESPWRVAQFTLVLVGPTALTSGVIFTLVGEALQAHAGGAATTTGALALANTLGALVGAPLAAFLLLPATGMQGAIFVSAIGYAVAGVFATRWQLTTRAVSQRAWMSPAISITAVALALVLFPFGLGDRYFLRVADVYADDGSRIVATREGPSETLFVMQQQWKGTPVYSRLITNGFSMSGTALQGQRYMRAFVYYPMLLHAGPIRRALVICYGVGVTAAAATQLPSVDTIDVAEISRDVVAMSDVIYKPGERPLQDPRVHLHIEDGRLFLQATPDRYDLITGEPPPPRTPGAVNIYTREYFQLIYDRLAEGGMATYWVPVARPQPGTDVNTIIRAFCDVFADCSLWNATPFDLMLLGSRHGEQGPGADAFTRSWVTPGLEARLREVAFERPEQIGATFVGDAAYLSELTASTPPLTDDFPQLLRPGTRPSLSDPRYGLDPFVTQMYESVLDPVRARAAFAASRFVRRLWPPDLIEATLPAFSEQAMINRVYWEGGRPVALIRDLHAALTSTRLRTLPLWILGSDDVKQRLIEASHDTSGAVEYARALRAFQGRDYRQAAEWLAKAGALGLQGATVHPLRAYALAMSGNIAAAAALLASEPPKSDDERQFRQWFASTFPIELAAADHAPTDLITRLERHLDAHRRAR
jgi:predicted membrane-bound spermidine synthase